MNENQPRPQTPKSEKSDNQPRAQTSKSAVNDNQTRPLTLKSAMNENQPRPQTPKSEESDTKPLPQTSKAEESNNQPLPQTSKSAMNDNQPRPQTPKSGESNNQPLPQISNSPVKHIFVGAIDFGTSYSGFAYSSKERPSDIYFRRWSSGYSQLETEKTPTSILFDSDKECLAFGYEAENHYAGYTPEKQHEMYFLRNYKMALYGKTVVRKDLMVPDVAEKEFPLFRAVSASLSYIKDALLDHILQGLANKELAPTDVMYVLTVPAIWSDSAKDFMRQAAEDAGIPSDMLLLCLEPEAAAIYCMSVDNLSLNSKRELSGFVDKFAPTKKYIVVDAGGGTVDIIAHEVGEKGALKEIYPATGGDGGGTVVDEQFLGYMKKIYGNDVVGEFRNSETQDYLELIRELEVKKRNVPAERDKKKLSTRLRVPVALFNIFRSKKKKRDISKDDIKDKPVMNESGDKLDIPNEELLNLFSSSEQQISKHVHELLKQKELSDVSTIILVGGYAESKVLQDYMEQTFGPKTIIVPHRAGSAVMRGAVVFGHDPSIIDERRCKFTYGIRINKLFDANIHNISTKFIDEEGDEMASGCFDIHVKVGQNVKTGSYQPEQSYIPLQLHAKTAVYSLYSCPRMNPVYVSEDDCVKICELEVDRSDLKGTKLERSILVALCFSGTEITIKATKKQTGEVLSTKIKYDW